MSSEYVYKLLLQQTDRTIVTISLIRLDETATATAVQSAEDQFRELDRLMSGSSAGVGFLADRRVERLDAPVADELRARVEQSLESLRQGRGFRAEITVGFSEPSIPSTLFHAVACDLFGHDAFEAAEDPDQADRDLVDVAEAGQLFRLPLPTEQGVPGMEQERLRVLPISRSMRELIERPGRLLLAHGFSVRQEAVPVAVSVEDLRTHVYVCGRTGTGKSTLLLRLACSVMEAGLGLCLVDPHGQLVEDVLARVPSERVPDVVVFNPASDADVGLNLFESDGSPEEQDFIVQEFVGMMFRLFDPESMGPMFERLLRNTLRLLMAAHEPLVEAARLYRDADFRQRCLAYLDRESPRDSELLGFWSGEFKQWSGSHGAEMTTYTLSKLDRFVADATMRRILGAKRSSFDMSSIMDSSRILFAVLPKGVLGEVNSSLLGMILSSKIQLAALRRARVAVEQRRDFCLIIDEFQSFVSSAGGASYSKTEATFGAMLSEARKYRLSLVLANQFLSQLDRGVRQAVFGNIGSQIVFRMSPEDSMYLIGQFPGSGLSPSDLQGSPRFHAYANLSVNGTQQSITLRTLPPSSMPSDSRLVARMMSPRRNA